METPDSVSSLTTQITHQDVIDYFNIIQKKYYFNHGYLTTVLPDEFALSFINNPSIVWNETYNHFASDYVSILSTDIFVNVFNIKLKIRLERPSKQDHHCEFEEYFCFGGHNSGFTTNRIVASFAKSFDPSIDVASVLSSQDVLDETYAKQAMLLLLFGGYIKVWSGFYAYNNWFSSKNIGLGDIKTCCIAHQYILDNFEIMVASEPAAPAAASTEPEPAAASTEPAAPAAASTEPEPAAASTEPAAPAAASTEPASTEPAATTE